MYIFTPLRPVTVGQALPAPREPVCKYLYRAFRRIAPGSPGLVNFFDFGEIAQGSNVEKGVEVGSVKERCRAGLVGLEGCVLGMGLFGGGEGGVRNGADGRI